MEPNFADQNVLYFWNGILCREYVKFGKNLVFFQQYSEYPFFQEAERLDDSYGRLVSLRRYAVALNISQKSYVVQDLAMEIGNLCRSIRRAVS